MSEGGGYAPSCPDAQQQPPRQTLPVVMPKAAPPSKPSSKCFVRRTCAVWHREKAQQWLNQRFAGLTPSDLNRHGDILFFCTASLEHPAGFEDHWGVYDRDADEAFHITEEQRAGVVNAAAVAMMCDFRVPAQVNRLCRICTILSELDDAPPIFWMPHSNAETSGGDISDTALHDKVMNSGVDDVIVGEPGGIELAIVLLSRISKSRMLAQKMNDTLNQRHDYNVRAQYLQNCVHSIVWDYLRMRLNSDIPAIDRDQPPGLPTHVDGWQLGQQLGQGSFGTVYALAKLARSQSGNAEQKRGVLKVIAKAGISNINGLKSIKHQIHIMRRVSQEFPHPGIINFLQAHHTKTHIMFLMEDGGRLNLFRRLRMRQREPQNHMLSMSKVISIISQALQAVQHMHMVCQVAHRDIKPENICIREEGDEITLKFIDFDVALVVRGGDHRSTTICGTFPFTAPEVHLEDSYLPFPADMWSLGILFAEILCGTNVIEDFVLIMDHLHEHKQENERMGITPSETQTARYLVAKIAEKFAEEGSLVRMLAWHSRPELHTLVEPVGIFLGRMIVIEPMDRFSSSEALHLYHNDLGLFPSAE